MTQEGMDEMVTDEVLDGAEAEDVVDFEGDLVIAAAMRGKVDYLVTNDERLLRHCPVAALSAFDMCKVLEMRSI